MYGHQTTPEECLEVAMSELKVAQRVLEDKIRKYPSPIALCDCEFNFLLGQRSKIAAALAILETEAIEMVQKAY